MPQEFNADLPHLTMRGLIWGDSSKDPIIALHGWLDNAASFSYLAPLLDHYQVIAPDLAGHGFSDHRPKGIPYYVWDNVADVLALADYLELNRFHLVGHSMGAGIGSLLAAVAPERVISLVLLDGLVPVTTSSEQSPQQMALALRQRSRIASKPPRFYERFDDAVVVRSKGLFPVPYEAAKSLVSRAITETPSGWQWHTDPYLFVPSVLRLTEEQVAEFLRVIKSPVLLCLAEEGIATAQTHQLAKCVTDMKTECLPGGHHFHLENTTVLALATYIIRHLQNS